MIGAVARLGQSDPASPIRCIGIAAVLAVTWLASGIRAWAGALPSTAGSGSVTATSTPRGNLDMLIRGLADSMERAAGALRADGQRLQATKSLDDARRAARVLDEVRTRLSQRDASLGIANVDDARHALQMGDAQRSARILLDGARRLRASLARDTSIQSDAAPGLPLEKSLGKGVINARGEELGKLDRLVLAPAGRRYAVLKEGGVVDLFGFLDVANRLVVVPTDQLIAGGRMVAVASDVTARQLESSSPFQPARHSVIR